MGQALQQGAARTGGVAGSAAAAAMSDVMTVSDVAGILKVGEDDVLALINAGDLKAKKIGNSYRVGREALQAYLNK
jgi:excisionase family DNA binding protein